jgi:hypothetical protein
MDSIDLSQYDQMIWIIIEEIFNKNESKEVESLNFETIQSELLNILVELYSKNSN